MTGNPTQTNPYVGPRPFEQVESKYFFGRDEETKILSGLVIAHQLSLFYAQSGAGKSSLLRAGLLPRLTRKTRVGSGENAYLYQTMQVLPIVTVGRGVPPSTTEPISNIFSFSAQLSLLPSADPNDLALLRLEDTVEILLDDGIAAGAIWEPAQERNGRVRPSLVKPDTALLIFDQFEEIFTVHPERWREREAFFRQVDATLRRFPTLHILFTMREDYLAELTPYANLLTDDLRHRFRMERLRKAGALAAVVQPALAGEPSRTYAPGVAEALVDNLRRIQRSQRSQLLARVKQTGADGAAEHADDQGEYVEPVHLQIVCRDLWAGLPAERTEIQESDLQSFGDVDQALTNFYESTLAKVVTETSVSERALRRWFNEELITPARTKGLVYRDDQVGETVGLANAAVDILRDAWIIRSDMRGGDVWYELAHDRLVEPILAANAKQQTPLALDAQAWLEAAKSPTHLYEGQQLADVARQLDENSNQFSELEKEFIQIGLTVEQNRKAKRQRLFTVGAVSIIVLLVALSGWAIRNAGIASQAQQDAEAAATVAAYARATAEAAKQETEELSSQFIADLEWQKHVSKSGWGVIFAADADPATREAIQDLLSHRRTQVGEYYREFSGADGYRSGERALDFLTRHGIAPGVTDFSVVPYYLLIVGSPQEIPFSFQYQMDINYAIGRIEFDTLEEYRNYALSVVTAENGDSKREKKMVVFAPQHADDIPTKLSLEHLVIPVRNQVVADKADWAVTDVTVDKATKEQLELYLGGKETPALFFFAGHGVPFDKDNPLLVSHQGALLTQDWPGPKDWRGRGQITSEFYFSVDDIKPESQLRGVIALLWGGYTVGTPKYDNFPRPGGTTLRQIAPHEFVAQLPKRLLSHPNGGALAVIGKVDQAWGSSFVWAGNLSSSEVFTDLLLRLMNGYPVGAALEPINQRYVALASEIAEIDYSSQWDLAVEPMNISSLRNAHIDSRNWIVIGDPAVRLMVDGLEPPIDGRLKQFRAQLLLDEARSLVYEADIPGAVEKYASALEFDNSLKIDPSAEIERLVPKAVQTLLELGRATARSGKWEDAVIQFEKALTLDPSLTLNPETEAKALTAQAFSDRATDLAETGVITEAIIKFEAALQLNPTLKISPTRDAITIGVPVLIEQARSFAEQGDIPNSLLKFKEAIRWDLSLDINPEQEAKRIRAQTLVSDAYALAKNHKITEATATLEEAIALDPSLGIDPVQEIERFAAQALIDEWDREQEMNAVFDHAGLLDSGWGIIFPSDLQNDDVPAIKDALKPLLDLRREQAGDFFRIYEGVDALRPDESKIDFLVRHGVPPVDPANPKKMPYYLLLVGTPEQIPYRFQSQLDVQYAVGRIHFDTIEEYRNYALSVVAHEATSTSSLGTVTLFSPIPVDWDNDNSLFEQSVLPISRTLGSAESVGSVTYYLDEEATKEKLTQLLGGGEASDLLIVVSQGLNLQEPTTERQLIQGAIVTEWTNQERDAIQSDAYFSGSDLTDDATPNNTIMMLDVPFSAGSVVTQTLETDAFIADLSKRNLGHSQSASLVIIGRIDTIENPSLAWLHPDEVTTQVTRQTIIDLLEGYPVGHAVSPFQLGYTSSVTDYSTMLLDVKFGLQVEPEVLNRLKWRVENLQSWTIVGDPAVKLNVRQQK